MPEEPLNKGFIYICYIYLPLQPENYANDGGYGYEYYRVQALQPLMFVTASSSPKNMSRLRSIQPKSVLPERAIAVTE